MKKLLCFAAFAAIICASSIASAQTCAGRCVRGAGRIVRAAAGIPCAGRTRCVYRSYSRAYVAPSYGFNACEVNACDPVSACEPIEATTAPCAPAAEYTPEPCGPAVATESAPASGVITRRYVERSVCPGGFCPLR